jgi:uncharacterized protein (TIGR02118 family)
MKGTKMHKLVILVETPEDLNTFDDLWPRFLHHAERMPGLKREATSRIDNVIYGKSSYYLIHELFFDSLQAIQEAMVSDAGQSAGEVLQKMTGGHMALMTADHKEDDMENILKFRRGE